MDRTDRTLDPAYDPAHDPTLGEVDRSVEVVAHAERLVADTRPVDTGRRVRLSKRVVTEERQVTVTVAREELVVEHLDADGRVVEAPTPVTEGDAYRSQTPAGELVLHEEVVEVVKSVRPVERVRLFLDTYTTAHEVTDTVAREVIEVEGDTEHRPLDRDPAAHGSVGAEVTDVPRDRV